MKLCSIGLFRKNYYQREVQMRVIGGRRDEIVFDFSEAPVAADSSTGRREETEMKHFLKEIETLGLPEVKNQPEIEKIKKRIEAFAKQYGEKTEKTTFIFMNYLETVRESGVGHLRNHDLLKAASYFAQCLRFVDPKYDEIFYEKFLIVKVDAVNKLMYCLFELEGQRARDLGEEQALQNRSDRYKNAQNILQRFLIELHEFQKIQSLKRSENCMLEVNYFFLGRLARKNKSFTRAISAFKTALELIEGKLQGKHGTRSEETRQFWSNLRVKIYYKLSKCFRDDNDDNNDERIKNEGYALKEAARIGNLKLQYYIRRKVQFYQAKLRFKVKLNSLQSKKMIEQQTFKLIEESRQTEIKSLYNVYNFQGISIR